MPAELPGAGPIGRWSPSGAWETHGVGAGGGGGAPGGGGPAGGGGGGIRASDVFPAVGLGPPRREQEVGQDALFVA